MKKGSFFYLCILYPSFTLLSLSLCLVFRTHQKWFVWFPHIEPRVKSSVSIRGLVERTEKEKEAPSEYLLWLFGGVLNIPHTVCAGFLLCVFGGGWSFLPLWFATFSNLDYNIRGLILLPLPAQRRDCFPCLGEGAWGCETLISRKWISRADPTSILPRWVGKRLLLKFGFWRCFGELWSRTSLVLHLSSCRVQISELIELKEGFCLGFRRFFLVKSRVFDVCWWIFEIRSGREFGLVSWAECFLFVSLFFCDRWTF